MEEFPNEEQAQEQITNENIKEFLTSKTLKKRIAAYKEIEHYPELVCLVQNETLTVALEPAITCLLQFKGELTNNEINNLYSQFTQTKASIKSLLSDLIDKVFQNDQSGVVKGLVANFSHKNAKVVFGSVQKVKDLIIKNLEFFNSKEGKSLIIDQVCPQLESVFSSTDKDVKSEGALLTLEIFKIIYELTLKFLENVKPIILKDLKDLFSSVEIPPREVKINDLSFDHSDWKERLAALNFLKENIANMSNKNEVVSILYRKTKDPNIQVVISAVECIKRGEIKHPDCIRGMIDRFKDKKAPLTSLIKETIQLILPDINLLIDCLDSKNPEIKIGILECLMFYSTVIRAKDIGKLLDDSSADVRRLSIAVLNQADSLEGLTEGQLSKLKKRIPHVNTTEQVKVPVSNVTNVTFSSKNDTKLNKNTSLNINADISPNKLKVSNKPIGVPKQQEEVKMMIPDVEIFEPSNFDFIIDQANKTKINDQFIEKYPFLMEKDWAKKLEAINNYSEQFKNESPLSIILYLICSKETNFHIFKAFLTILGTFPSLNMARTPLISFLNSKITETKLKDSMIVLYRKLDQNFTVQNFIHCLKTNKTGKKFLIFLEFFILVLKSKNPLVDYFLTDFRVIGAQEKKALNSFIDEYHKLGDMGVQVDSNSLDNTEIFQKPIFIDDEKTNSIMKNDIKMAKFEILTTDKVNYDKKPSISIFNNPINQSRIKNCEIDLSKIFTSEFLQLFKTDIRKAVMILEKSDFILISDHIISLYCQYSAPSTYFNSLILYFISSKYILQENEASFLTKFLVEHSMDLELELMDRIYPATKLYKVLRSISTEKGFKAVFSLICKYKNLKDLKYNEIERTVIENEDFIGFSIEIDKIIKMKEELRKKYENPEENQFKETQKGNNVAFNSNELSRKQSDINKNTFDGANSIFIDATVTSVGNSGIQQQKIDGTFKLGNDQRNKETSYCLNSNEDQTDINDLEDSIIVESTPSIDQILPDPIHVTASIIIASSVADVDTLTSTIINSNVEIAQPDMKNENSCKNISLLTDGNASFEIPETLVDGENQFDHEIEQSLENISISTTPQKKKRNFNQVENFLDSIMSENETESKTGLENISKMVSNDPQALLFSCNTIISTLLNLLKNKYENIEMRDLILSILLKFTQNSDISTAIRYETLVFINTTLIPIVKDNVIIADILINLCLNCDLQILRVYFDLLNNTDEILMKLIWRHSKRVNYSSTENSAVVVRIIDSFYQSKKDFLFQAENIVLKVCLLHLKECIAVFSDNIKEFGISEVTNSIVNLLITTKDLNLEAIRAIYKK